MTRAKKAPCGFPFPLFLWSIHPHSLASFIHSFLQSFPPAFLHSFIRSAPIQSLSILHLLPHKTHKGTRRDASKQGHRPGYHFVVSFSSPSSLSSSFLLLLLTSPHRSLSCTNGLHPCPRLIRPESRFEKCIPSQQGMGPRSQRVRGPQDGRTFVDREATVEFPLRHEGQEASERDKDTIHSYQLLCLLRFVILVSWEIAHVARV